jgi:hypothetical protein
MLYFFQKRGIVEWVVIVLIFIMASFGTMYLYMSKEGNFSAFRESFKIRARLLAKSGLEVAECLLKKAYSKGKYDWEYPEQRGINFPSYYFKQKLADGFFEIEEIKPAYVETVKGELGPYQKVPYVVNGVKKGDYTLYQVTVAGYVRDVRVTLKSIVKVIKYEVSY